MSFTSWHWYTNHTSSSITSHFDCVLSDLNKLQRFDIYLKKINVQVYTILSLDRKMKRKRYEKNSKKGHWQGFTRYYNCLMLSPLPPHSIWVISLMSGYNKTWYSVNERWTGRGSIPASILRKSTSGRHRPVSYPDGPMTARYRFT